MRAQLGSTPPGSSDSLSGSSSALGETPRGPGGPGCLAEGGCVSAHITFPRGGSSCVLGPAFGPRQPGRCLCAGLCTVSDLSATSTGPAQAGHPSLWAPGPSLPARGTCTGPGRPGEARPSRQCSGAAGSPPPRRLPCAASWAPL